MFKDVLPAVYRAYYRCKLEYKHDYPDRLVHLKLESLELGRLY